MYIIWIDPGNGICCQKTSRTYLRYVAEARSVNYARLLQASLGKWTGGNLNDNLTYTYILPDYHDDLRHYG